MRWIIALLAFVGGIVLGVNWEKAACMAFYNDQPEDPPEWEPRMRNWRNGAEIFD